MSLNLQYLLVGIVIGVCLSVGVRALRRALRHGKSPGCHNCAETGCPLRK